jgi:integrase
MAEWHAARRANRKTRISPSQLERERKRAKKPRPRQPGEFYTTGSYRVAILNAITKGNKTLPDGEKIPHWSPYQIRHSAGTAAEKESGLDKAQALLGHTSANTTKRYAHGRLAITEDMARNRRNPFEDSTEEE